MTSTVRASRHLLAVSRHLLLAGCAISGVAGAPAFAQTAVISASTARPFDIPAQPLRDALRQLMRQGNLQIGFEAGDVNDRTSSAISGRMTTGDALSRLLAGTGLGFRYLTNGSVVVERAPQVGQGVIQLDTLRVQGASEGIAAGRGSTFGDGGDTGDLAYVSPQSSSYITRDEIERNRGFQASDMFRGTPGVLSGDARNSGALDINIRGMQGMNRVPVVIDGSQQSTTVYRGYSGVASRSYIDPDMIGGVEVLKGPTSGVEGVGSVGGVVSMRTINASDILLPGRTFGIRVRGGFNTNTREAPEPYTTGGLQSTMTGSYLTGCNFANCGTIVTPPSLTDVDQLGNTRGLNRPSWIKPTGGNGSIAIAKTWEGLDLVGAVTYRNTGNYFAGTHGDAPELTLTQQTTTLSGGRERYYTVIGFVAQLNRFRAGEEVLNTSSENLSFLGKATIRPFDDHVLELGYMKFKSWFGELMPSSIIRGTGALQAPMSRIDLDTYTARYTWNPDSELIDLRANASRTELDNRIRTAYDLFNLPALRFISTYDARTIRNAVDIANHAEIGGVPGRLSANLGGSFSFEDTRTIPGAPTPIGDGLARNGWRREYSGFGDFEYSPVEFLKFNGALRYTAFQSYDRNLAYGTTEHIAHDQDGWAPIAAITMIPRSWLQVYARYAQAIRMPSLFEVTSGWSTSPGYDTEVRPERARNWEFGINVSKDGLLFGGDQLRTKLAYFNNNVKDYLTRASSGSDALDRGEMVRNIDRARFKGYEGTLEYRQGPLAIELFATHYSLVQFCYYETQGTSTNPLAPTYDCAGSAPSGSYARNHVPPEWAGGGSINLSLFDKKLNLFGRVTHTHTRVNEEVNLAGAVTVVRWTPYTLVDASVSYKLNQNVRFELTGDNLTDKYYMDALTLGLMASPGRTIRGSVTFNF